MTPLLVGSCLRIAPAFIAEAQETGGQLFFLARDQAGLTFSLIQPQLKGNLVPVLSTSGALASGGSATVAVPVDSTVESVTFSVSIDAKGAINVLRPPGTTVSPGDSAATITELSSGRVVTRAPPRTGNWQRPIGGAGTNS